MESSKLKPESFSNRLYNLDYLRGLAAFGIMIYHYISSIMGRFPSETFLARFGIYGVSTFYILSGLTLYHVYYNKMKPSKEDILLFFKKRIFRIFPLLWLITIISIILSHTIPDFTSLLLTFTGLFGFLNWEKYFSVGVWSIGNELVFYTFFPIFVLFSKRYKLFMILFTIIISGLYLYFAYCRLDPIITFDDQTKTYINPLNQIFLFLGGFLIGLFLNNVRIKNSIILILLLSGFVIFTFYPTHGDIIFLVTGTNR